MTRRTTPRRATAVLLASLLLPALAGCGATSRDVLLACAAPEDCGPGARCVAGACQASTPPAADFSLPAGLVTHRPVAITASASDRDAGDRLRFAWAVTPVTAACEADLDVADAATLQAIFWCAGTYEVSLVVTDDAGAASAPVRRTASVEPLAGAPSVTAGAPVEVEHGCGGEPLQCGLAQPVALSATAQAPLGGPITYRWTAVPPDPARAGAAAALAPSPASPQPVLTIATAGGPISGAWRLRVRATDGQGNVAQAFQQVTVGNRPPAIDAAALAFDHRYDGTYRVDGAVAVPVTDPDGDPLVRSLSLAEPSGSGCTASLAAVAGTSGTLALSCPTPEGLLAAGRRLLAAAADPNGGVTTAEVGVEVRNRAPVVAPAGGAAEVVAPHVVGPCADGGGSCFLASGPNPFVAVDPDGDPLAPVELAAFLLPEVAHATLTIAPGAEGGFTWSAPTAYPEEFMSRGGSTGVMLAASARDALGAVGRSTVPLRLLVQNQPPRLRLAPAAVAADHRYDAQGGAYLATAAVAAFEDPEGDPIVLLRGDGDAECATFGLDAGIASVTCRRAYTPSAAAPPDLAGFAGVHAVSVLAGDGWEAASHAATVSIRNGAPTVPAFDGELQSCLCRCARWSADEPGVCAVDPTYVVGPPTGAVPARPADADGDPLRATFALAPGSAAATLSPTAVTGLPAACTTTVSAGGYPVVLDVTVSDGERSAVGRWTVRGFTCAKAGQACSTPAARR